MCDPLFAASAVISTVGAVAQVEGQKKQAKAQEKYQNDLAIQRDEQIAENKQLSYKSYREQLSQVDRRTIEQGRQASQQIAENAKRSTEAQAQAAVAAAEAGVEGNSVMALFHEFKRTEGTFKAITQSNLQGASHAAQDEKRALKAQAEGRAASIPKYVPEPVSKPDYLGAALRIGAGVLDAGTKYRGWGGVKAT